MKIPNPTWRFGVHDNGPNRGHMEFVSKWRRLWIEIGVIAINLVPNHFHSLFFIFKLEEIGKNEGGKELKSWMPLLICIVFMKMGIEWIIPIKGSCKTSRRVGVGETVYEIWSLSKDHASHHQIAHTQNWNKEYRAWYPRRFKILQV